MWCCDSRSAAQLPLVGSRLKASTLESVLDKCLTTFWWRLRNVGKLLALVTSELRLMVQQVVESSFLCYEPPKFISMSSENKF